jgi:hypothetical protein
VSIDFNIYWKSWKDEGGLLCGCSPPKGKCTEFPSISQTLYQPRPVFFCEFLGKRVGKVGMVMVL